MDESKLERMMNRLSCINTLLSKNDCSKLTAVILLAWLSVELLACNSQRSQKMSVAKTLGYADSGANRYNIIPDIETDSLREQFFMRDSCERLMMIDSLYWEYTNRQDGMCTSCLENMLYMFSDIEHITGLRAHYDAFTFGVLYKDSAYIADINAWKSILHCSDPEIGRKVDSSFNAELKQHVPLDSFEIAFARRFDVLPPCSKLEILDSLFKEQLDSTLACRVCLLMALSEVERMTTMFGHYSILMDNTIDYPSDDYRKDLVIWKSVLDCN